MRKENQKYHILRFPLSGAVDITLKDYEGFRAVETGSIIVDYKKEGYEFLHTFKIICLERYAHNDFYFEPYAVVCYELELEGIGVSKEKAYEHLHELLEFYFDGTCEHCDNVEEFRKIINNNIDKQNYWKDSFRDIYKSLKGD